MRKSVAAMLMAGVLCSVQSAQSGPVRIIVAPWHPFPIVVAPRVVVAPVPVAPAGKGFIDLDVTPMDAQVWVDGEYVGLASHFSGEPTYMKLASGSHTVQLARDGFAAQRFTVVVEPNRLITLDVGLVPVAAAPAVVAAPVVAATDVAPAPAASAAPVAESAPATDAVPVVEEPPTYQLDLEKTGYLALTVAPADASLYIDDKPYGVAAEYNDDKSIVLRAGSHTVQVIRPGYVSNVQTVEIVSDTTKTVSVTLTKE